MTNTSKGDKDKKNIRIPSGKPEWKEGPQLPPEIIKKLEQQQAKQPKKGSK